MNLTLGPASIWVGSEAGLVKPDIGMAVPVFEPEQLGPPVVPAVPGWKPFADDRVGGAVTITIDRLLMPWTSAGRGIPSRVFSKGLMLMAEVMTGDLSVASIRQGLQLMPGADVDEIVFDVLDRRVVDETLGVLIRGASGLSEDPSKFTQLYMPYVKQFQPFKLSVGTDEPATLLHQFQAIVGSGGLKPSLQQS